MPSFIIIYDKTDECYDEFDKSEHIIINGEDHITRYKDGKIVEQETRRTKS